jgi:hypothetical protein
MSQVYRHYIPFIFSHFMTQIFIQVTAVSEDKTPHWRAKTFSNSTSWTQSCDRTAKKEVVSVEGANWKNSIG